MHINLLRENELRYQGLVGLRMVKLMVLSLSTGLLLVFSLVALANFVAWHARLKNCRQQWSAVRLRYQTAQLMQSNALIQAAILNEVYGWRKARVDCAGFLTDLQRSVPSNIQLARLGMQMDWQMLKTGGPAAEAGGGPALQMKLSLSGSTRSSLTDDAITPFYQKFTHDPALKLHLASVDKPQVQIERGLSGTGADLVRSFDISATGPARKME